jgi:predicted nucleic acid-binding protein
VVQNFIVDTSVLIQAFIRDQDTPRARTLLRGVFDLNDPTVIHVPESCLLECANILWKRVQFQSTSLDAMQRALNTLLATPLTVQPVITLVAEARQRAKAFSNLTIQLVSREEIVHILGH